MADGTVRINIELVKNAFQQALQSLEKETKTTTTRTGKSLQDVARETGKTVNQIRSEVMKASAQYQKDGLSKSEAVKKAYEDIGVSAETTTTKVTKMSGLLKASLVGLSTVGIAAVGAIAKAGISFNAQMESYTSNFKVLLGSQEKALERVNYLKDLAAKTPFELTDLADATQTLLSFQVSADETNEILEMLGDVSLGNKEKLSSLALVFGQVSSAGKLTGQDLLQFVNVGFNPLNYIAKRTGESMEELRDRMSRGAIGVDEVKQAFIDATSEGGQFYKGMEEGSKTFLGQLSTLKDNFNEFSGNIMRPLFNFLSQTALPSAINLVGALNNNVDTLISTATGLATAFATLKTLPMLASAWGTATAGLQLYLKTGQGLSVTSALVGLLTRQITLSQVATQGATTATSLWTKALSFLSANKFLIIASAVVGIGTALFVASKRAGGFSKLFENIGQKISTFTTKAGEFITAFVENLTKNAPQIVKAISETFNTVVQSLVENLPKFIEMGVSLINSLVNGITQALPVLVEAIPQIMLSLINGIITALPQIIVAGYQILITLLGSIIQNLPTIIQAGYKIVFAILGAIIQSLPQILNAGIQLIQMLWQGIQSLIPWLLQQLKTFVAQIPERIKSGIQIVKNIGRTLVQLLWQGISSLVSWLLGKVKSFASDIPDKIKQGFSNIKNIGRNLVEGLWNGIGNAKDWILDKIKGFGGDILDEMADFFGINSPSTVMRDFIGKNLVLGMAVGIDKNAKYALKSMKSLGTKIQKTANIPVSIGKSSAGSYYNHSVTNDSRQVIQNFYNKTTTPYEAYKKVGGAFEY